MIVDEYYDKLVATLGEIKATQQGAMMQAAEAAAKTIADGGIIYLFGCGHSHLIALDCFYRAGGLANVSAVLDTDLMLHNGAAKSSKLERMSGIAESVFERYCMTERDMLFVISTSGKNAVPVEMAQTAVRRGIRTVAVVSGAYFADKKDAPMLYECADMFIDNCVPHGDAVMDIDGCETKMGSVSTAASSYILQAVLMQAAELAAAQGARIPVYMSGNVEGGAEFNRSLIKEYLPRIKHL